MASPAVPRGLEVVRDAAEAAFLLEPTRRRLLAELKEPESAAGLARRLGLPRQRVNYHLRELERAGCIELVEERRKRGCTERLMRATARAFILSPEAVGAFGETPGEAADRASVGYFVASANRALREVGELEARARKAGKRLATLTLDTEIRFGSAAARAAFASELTAALTELTTRYHDAEAPQGRSFRLTTLIHPLLAPSREPSDPGASHG